MRCQDKAKGNNFPEKFTSFNVESERNKNKTNGLCKSLVTSPSRVQLHAYIIPTTSFCAIICVRVRIAFESLEIPNEFFISIRYCSTRGRLLASVVSNKISRLHELSLIHMEIYPFCNHTRGMLDFLPGINGNGFAIWFLWSSKLQLSITGSGTIYWLGSPSTPQILVTKLLFVDESFSHA